MFYLINKKAGISSFAAIREFAKENNIEKLGHTGTLDPMATGALLIATGDDTKLIKYLNKDTKTYIAKMKLGLKSNTLDTEGTVEEVDYIPRDIKEIEEVIKSFEGIQKQTPPAFSAKKVNGVRSYKLAREGKEVELDDVDVEIFHIDKIKLINDNEIEFETKVSRGTYIRSLIRDIGKKLDTEAVMTYLRREYIGDVKVAEKPQKVSFEQISTYETIELKDVTDLMHGKAIEFKNPNGTYALKYKDTIIGVGRIRDNKLKAKKILGNKVINK